MASPVASGRRFRHHRAKFRAASGGSAMTDNHQNFPKLIRKLALVRQKFRCASCGTPMTGIGESGSGSHRFGERAEGHHLIPHKGGGPISIDNCVVLCRTCHYSAHQGGRWRDVSIYADLTNLSMSAKIAGIAALYPHYS
jgi:hypothetical protein